MTSMSKAVLISIKPEWCEKIFAGKKTIEIRKSTPKLKPPFKCYIYCTKDGFKSIFQDGAAFLSHNAHVCNGKVVGEFVCDHLCQIRVFSDGAIQGYHFNKLEDSCLSYDEIAEYIGAGYKGSGWHISNLVLYDKPKELSNFEVERYPTMDLLKRPPQSWCYVEEWSGGGQDG